MREKMYKVLIVGKTNGILKNIMECLSNEFKVQVCAPSPDSVMGMIGLVEPDILLISLVGITDFGTVIFNRIEQETPWLPVVTIGTEIERNRFLKYYGNNQFENLARPIDNSFLLYNIKRKIKSFYKAEDIDPDETYEPQETEKQKPKKNLVLLVDDDPGMLRTLSSMIQDKYDVIATTGAAGCMSAMGRRKPDAVLLDYEMPVCDGKQTLEMIRSEPDFKDIPVVFLTSVKDRSHIEAVLALRPAGYLLKPSSMDVIRSTLEKIMVGQSLY